MRNIGLYILDNLSTLLMFLVFYTMRILKAPLWWVKVKTFQEWYRNSNENEHTNDLIRVLVVSITYSTIYFFGLFWLSMLALALTVASIIYESITTYKNNKKRKNEKGK